MPTAPSCEQPFLKLSYILKNTLQSYSTNSTSQYWNYTTSQDVTQLESPHKLSPKVQAGQVPTMRTTNAVNSRGLRKKKSFSLFRNYTTFFIKDTWKQKKIWLISKDMLISYGMNDTIWSTHTLKMTDPRRPTCIWIWPTKVKYHNILDKLGTFKV